MIRRISAVALTLALLGAIGVPAALAQKPGAEADNRTIVVFRQGVDPSEGAASLVALGPVLQELPLVNGVVVAVPARAAATVLAYNPLVEQVEADQPVSTAVKPDRTGKPPKDDSDGGKPSKETLPWGVDRIDADLAWTETTADAVRVGIIDTGIDGGHPDLAANIAGGFSAVSYTTSWQDDNGHGTHVAGIAGAVADGNGVIGVAPSVDLYALKVLDDTGSGWVSDIIQAIDWAIANDLDVINMSLGGSTYSSSFADAVRRADAAGIVVVAAAGNSGPDENSVQYPAAYDHVIAVGATDSSDSIASFSSRGPEVDLAAPGVQVESTYWHPRRGSIYRELSGTSMAAPHVAGAAALALSMPVTAWDVDGDSSWDPFEIEAKLEAGAEDLGVAGFDTHYGNGLVDAEAAVAP